LSLVFDATFVLAGLAETRFRTLGLRKVLLRMRSPGKLHILERKEQILLQGKKFVFSPESPDFEDCDERTGQLVIKEHTCSPAPFTLAFDSLEKLLKQRC
jgi:hypothetical protein